PKKAAAPKVFKATKDSHKIVAEIAYYIAEKQNFTPGMELNNWLEAERLASHKQ
ncbi:MAG: DUF2934 domain-containing protein, partial [Bacteriovoracaceae bacterium]|nr:DUF2934 domain-containing protein [Bacteriovoracaceae bacterium]